MTMNISINPDIMSPEDALASFRVGRLAESVEAITSCTRKFDEEATASLDGKRPAKESVKALTKAFVASYRAFSEAQDSAKAAGVVNGATVDALHGVMTKLRQEFKAGIASMSDSVDRLNAHSPGAFGEFCQSATDRLKRLEQFWHQTYEQVPKAPKMTM